MKMKVYNVYLDCGNDALKVTVPAENVKKAAQYVEGNGEIIAIKEHPYLQNIDIECLANTLKNSHWGQTEIDVITRCLVSCGLDR